MVNEFQLMAYSLKMAEQMTPSQSMSINPSLGGIDPGMDLFGLGDLNSAPFGGNLNLFDSIFQPSSFLFDDFNMNNQQSFSGKSRFGLKISPIEAVRWAKGEVGTVGGTKYTGKNDVAWCAAFVDCAYGGFFNTLSTSRMKKIALNKGLYRQGNDLQGLKIGDIVLLQPDTNPKGTSHASIVSKIDYKNGYYWTIDGNYGNKVKECRHRLNNNHADGYISMGITTDTNTNNYDAIA